MILGGKSGNSWSLLSLALSVATGFERELMNFTGERQSAGSRRKAAFQRLVEAMEVTAIQRGSERWRPT